MFLIPDYFPIVTLAYFAGSSSQSGIAAPLPQNKPLPRILNFGFIDAHQGFLFGGVIRNSLAQLGRQLM
jgi:hypothetical protein